jgi:hypothetical protein
MAPFTALVAAGLLMAPGCSGNDPASGARVTADAPALAPAPGSPAPGSPAPDDEAGQPSPPPRIEGPPGQSGAEAGLDGFIGDDGEAPGVLSPDSSCAASVLEAETIERVVEIPVEEEVVVPTVFYLMLDSSGSMVNDPFTLAGLVEDILDIFGLGQSPPQPTKWDYAVSGLKSFIGDPASAGLELALGYFPDAGQCDGSGYDVPQVALAALPDNIAPLESSLDARAPAGGTPLEGALRGATDFCLALNAERPDRSCVAVLITDGAAEECSARGADELASIAGSAAERGVLTFAAGMQGADFAVLDAIGRAGGSDCDPSSASFACDLTADRDAFVAALDRIRDSTRTRTRIETRIERQVQTLPCEWPIPAPPPGQAFDPGRVNVQLSLPGAEPLGVENVATEADCASAGGWYYDEPAAPSTIKACPATCEQLGAEPDTRVELLFGCATVIR